MEIRRATVADAKHLSMLIEDLALKFITAEFTAEHLQQHFKKRSVAVKLVLMDNHVVVGVGNIYASEALFVAGIRPTKRAHLLTGPQATRLHTAVREVLSRAGVALGPPGVQMGADIGFFAIDPVRGAEIVYARSWGAPKYWNDAEREAVAVVPLSIPLLAGPGAIAVPVDSPYQSLKDLVADAKANPGKVSFASYSAGTSSHYAGMILNQKAGLDMQHVSFAGIPPALTQVMGNQAKSFSLQN